MSLRPLSTSPSTSPAPPGGNIISNGSVKTSSRASLGPSVRPAPINLVNAPASPRLGTGRPTSELLSGAGSFQTPESEAIDQWFENLQNYEATLEEMAAASLDVNFKEELGAIEQWFRVLSEAERTAALYSLLQHSTQVQIRFFITVLQQMARADPMTALLSPSAGGSMQSQMEAKLSQLGLKSPALNKSFGGPPASPSGRGSSASNLHRQSLAVLESSSASPSVFLSPDSAANRDSITISGASDAAATLAQQRAKLKANAAHRISAPPVSGMGAGDRMTWGSQLGQVAERSGDAGSATGGSSRSGSPAQEASMPTSVSGGMAAAAANGSIRPKSMDVGGLLRSPRPAMGGDVSVDNETGAQEVRVNNTLGAGTAGAAMLSPMVGGNWASMVNTPMVPMFDKNIDNGAGQNLDAAATKLANWQMGNSGGRFSLDDAKKFRRPTKPGSAAGDGSIVSNAIYGDDGNMISRGRAGAAGNNVGAAMRSPALSNVSSGRFGSDAGDSGFGGMGVPSPGVLQAMGMGNLPLQQQMSLLAQMQGMNGLNGMGGMNGLNMNGMAGMNGMGGLNPALASMMGGGLSPEAQLLAAQMAASGFMQPGLAGMAGGPYGMNGLGVGGMPGMMGAGAGARGGNRASSGRTGLGGSTGSRSNNGRDTGTTGAVKPGGGGAGDKGVDDDVDPALLADIPAWFRKLRLHKYTHLFDGSDGPRLAWRDLVVMSEEELERRGVAALGARRKMLKTFEVVRARMGIEMPGDGEGEGVAEQTE